MQQNTNNINMYNSTHSSLHKKLLATSKTKLKLITYLNIKIIDQTTNSSLILHVTNTEILKTKSIMEITADLKTPKNKSSDCTYNNSWYQANRISNSN